LTLPGCFLNSRCSASCRLAVVDRREEAAVTEEVKTTSAGPGRPSQCRSGQSKLLTSPEESPVGPVTCGGRTPRIFYSGGSSSSLESSLESSRPPHLRSPDRTDIESVAPRASLFSTAPGAQGGLFLNGDGFVRWGDASGAAGWTRRVLCAATPGGVGDSVDGSSAGQPADGSTGRRRPASGRGETEEVDRCAVRLLGQGLVEEREAGGRVVVSCRQK
jgi:hypothetical protein